MQAPGLFLRCRLAQLRSEQAVRRRSHGDRLSENRYPGRRRSVTARAEWQRRGDVAVLGSGIMGLTTAIQIKQQWSNIGVDIISDGTFHESTSHGAGGANTLAI